MALPLRFPIAQRVDIEITRRAAKKLALENHFTANQIDEIVIVVSELATNLLRYANGGSITLSIVDEVGRSGLRIESRDVGPGIQDLDLALQDGYSSTAGSIGSGLPIVRRQMDEFWIDTSSAGTWIVACKWISGRSR